VRGKASRGALAALAALALIRPDGALARGGCVLPRPASADRISRAQLWLHDPAERAVRAGRIAILWSDDEGKPRLPGVYALKYMMADRDPDRTHDAAWYRAHHPEWMVTRCDGTPAPLFTYPWGTYTSVDVANPAVRQYLLRANLANVLGGARFDGAAVDNLDAGNIGGRCGEMTAAGFRRDFSGHRVDPAFARRMVDWTRWLRGQAHAGGLCLAGNDYMDDDDVDGFLAVAAELDIVVDEHGFTRRGRPLSLDDAWARRIAAYAQVAARKPLIVIDYPAQTVAELTPAALSWSIANFLLIKGPRTYLALTPLERSAHWVDLPALDLELGAPLAAMRRQGPLAVRRFAHAVAAVNSTRAEAARLVLPPGRWRGLDGAIHAGVIDVPPAEAFVLTAVR
jgi:hypothetical protein